MIKVLHLSSPKSWRGGEQQLAYLAEEHKINRLCQPIVLTSEESELSKWCIKSNIEHYTVNSVNLNLSSAFKINNIIKSKGINIIHCHDSKAHNAAIFHAILFKSKTPIIISRRVDFPVSNNLFSNYKYNHQNIKKIICVSETIKSITANSIKEKSKLITIHSGIDRDKFKDSNSVPLRKEFNINDDFLIGNTSAIAPHKDYPTFIEAAQVVISKKDNIKFMIVGDGPKRENIKKLIEEKGLQENIILTGFRKDIPDTLAAFDLFLITSETEGLGTSIIDAFASGTPVVATNAGGIPELVEHNKTGYLAEVKNIDSIVEGIFKVIENNEYKQRIIEGAKEKLKGFTKQKTAEDTFKVYTEILKDSGVL